MLLFNRTAEVGRLCESVLCGHFHQIAGVGGNAWSRSSRRGAVAESLLAFSNTSQIAGTHEVADQGDQQTAACLV